MESLSTLERELQSTFISFTQGQKEPLPPTQGSKRYVKWCMVSMVVSYNIYEMSAYTQIIYVFQVASIQIEAEAYWSCSFIFSSGSWIVAWVII